MSSIVKVDTIQENTSANGITVDGLNIKDSKLVTANSVVAANITADAIDATKMKSQLGWKPKNDFDSGIKKTVAWYLNNDWWWKPIRSGNYAGERLGVSAKVPK